MVVFYLCQYKIACIPMYGEYDLNIYVIIFIHVYKSMLLLIDVNK